MTPLAGQDARGDLVAPLPPGVRVRPAANADLPACARIWRDGLNEYMGRLNLPAIPPETGPIGRLHAHLLATDPERFLVAVRDDGQASVEGERDAPRGRDERLIAFAAAVRREGVWFLSMLFVRPGEQGRGLGAALLERLLPDDTATLATATDSAQPISNALYARHGIVPRMPLLALVGRPARTDVFRALPAAVTAIPFEEVAAGPPGGPGHAALVEAVDGLDREVAGFAHPADHRFLRLEGRRGFLYRNGRGEPLGYGYASEVGRVGPVAVRDETLMGPVLGHLLSAVVPRDASVLWVPGHADAAVVPLLASGMRLDGFPVLVCWSRPFADFRRYLPISPGLL